VTPPNAIRRGEIVEEIVDHLRPWKDRISEATVTAEVNRELDILLGYVPAQAGGLIVRGIAPMPKSSTVRSVKSRS
jgi:hypothetical protein